jgi:hypothetical protein
MPRLRFALACWALAGAEVPALGAQDSVPERRAHHALVYDPSRGMVLLAGGSTPLEGGSRFRFFNDLWSYGPAGWTRLGQSGEPVSGLALDYDTRRGRVLSFGGFDGRSGLGELRALAGAEWQVLGRLEGMPVAEPGFAYDSARDRFVAFGGSASQGSAAGETWEYDGAAWHRMAIPSPPARQAHAMGYDNKRGRLVLFGGMGSAAPGQRPPSLGDTWEYDGKAWVLKSGPGPSARHGAGMAFDEARGVMLLFGGAGESGFLGDTWSWDGTAWKRLADGGPEPRAMGKLAYDNSRGITVLFGGRKGWPDGDLNDTWEWDGAAWRRGKS